MRDRLLPLLDLAQLLKLEGARTTLERSSRTRLTVVVMQIGAQVFGVLVDSVFHTEEIVVKPMASLLRDVDHVLGQHHSRRRQRDHDHRSERARLDGRLRSRCKDEAAALPRGRGGRLDGRSHGAALVPGRLAPR